MNTREYAAAWLLLALCAVPARAAESSAAQFLKLGFGGRALGMGEAYVAVADDAAAVYYNPAGLAPAARGAAADPGAGRQAAFSHSWHIQDMGISQAAFLARPWGAALTYFSAGELEGRTAAGDPAGNFTASDIALSAGYGISRGGLRAGAAVKYIGQKIKDKSAGAFAADIGVLYSLEAAPLTFGVSAANLGTKVRFEEESFPLPLVLRAGAAMRLAAGTLLAVQADLPNDAGTALRLGAEYCPAAALRLRLGYKTSSSSDRDALLGRELGGTGSGLAGLYGLFAGLGLVYGEFRLDYALTPYGELGNAHRFSFAFKY